MPVPVTIVHVHIFRIFARALGIPHERRRTDVHNYTTAKGIIFHGSGERNRGYALLRMANKPETALYSAPTFYLLLQSHGGITV